MSNTKKLMPFMLNILFVFMQTSLANDSCPVGGVDFTHTAMDYRETFLDLDRQIKYARQQSIAQSLETAGLDLRMLDFIPESSLQKLTQSGQIDLKAVQQVATHGGYKPTRTLPDFGIRVYSTANGYAANLTPQGKPTHVYEVEGHKITIDVADTSGGRFDSHPHQDMNAHPKKTKYAEMDPDAAVAKALAESNEANPNGVPLSTGDSPVFYRVMSKRELLEILTEGQALAKGSVTDWVRDFATPLEKKWLEDQGYHDSSRNVLFKGKSAADIKKIKDDFRARFGREMPIVLNTQAHFKKYFVNNLLKGLENDNLVPPSKMRLPDSTKELLKRFTINGVLYREGLGRYLEDNIFSLPPGPKRNDAIVDIFGFDFAARLHEENIFGFDEMSPFKGTSIGLPMSNYIGDGTFVVAIRDVHGRARKNTTNLYEREWFFKDGIAIDEIAGVWSGKDLDKVPGGKVLLSDPQVTKDRTWNDYQGKASAESLGDPVPVIRFEQSARAKPQPPKASKADSGVEQHLPTSPPPSPIADNATAPVASAVGHPGTANIWDRLTPTSEAPHSGDAIPGSFVFEATPERIWVHPNATKHLREVIERDLARDRPSINPTTRDPVVLTPGNRKPAPAITHRPEMARLLGQISVANLESAVTTMMNSTPFREQLQTLMRQMRERGETPTDTTRPRIYGTIDGGNGNFYEIGISGNPTAKPGEAPFVLYHAREIPNPGTPATIKVFQGRKPPAP